MAKLSSHQRSDADLLRNDKKRKRASTGGKVKDAIPVLPPADPPKNNKKQGRANGTGEVKRAITVLPPLDPPKNQKKQRTTNGTGGIKETSAILRAAGLLQDSKKQKRTSTTGKVGDTVAARTAAPIKQTPAEQVKESSDAEADTSDAEADTSDGDGMSNASRADTATGASQAKSADEADVDHDADGGDGGEDGQGHAEEAGSEKTTTGADFRAGDLVYVWTKPGSKWEWCEARIAKKSKKDVYVHWAFSEGGSVLNGEVRFPKHAKGMHMISDQQDWFPPSAKMKEWDGPLCADRKLVYHEKSGGYRVKKM